MTRKTTPIEPSANYDVVLSDRAELGDRAGTVLVPDRTYQVRGRLLTAMLDKVKTYAKVD